MSLFHTHAVIRETFMIIKTTSLIAATAFLALSSTTQAAEPVPLGADELDSVTAGGTHGTTFDNIISDIGGGDVFGFDRDVGGDDDGVTGVVRLRVAF